MLASSQACTAAAFVVVLALPIASAAVCLQGAVSPNDAFQPADFERCETVAVGDARKGVNVHLLWRISGRGTGDEQVTLAAQFPSDKGWVAVGLSESGSMYGSDMTVVREVNGSFVAEDRHAMSSSTPSLDLAQDVTLLAAEASRGKTSVMFKRPTKTCRSSVEDLDFPDVLTAAIVAWGDSHEFAYHLPGRRATAWLNFFDPPVASAAQNGPGDLMTHTVQGNGLDVPVDKTVYCYSAHKLPQDKKYHVVRAEPIINSSHPELVHHMILYTCLDEFDPLFYNKSRSGPPVCAQGMQQRGMCYSFWILWAVGATPMEMPIGMPMGKSSLGDVTTARNVMLEVHYDNPGNVQIRDQSGFKLFYTDKLRANDAVIMTLGHLNINIPAGAQSHEHVNECAAACTKKLKQPVTALWAGLHMHSAGKEIWTQHLRGDKELAPLGRKRSWDFNQQSPSHVKAVIEPGDRLVTHCIYSSTRDTATTFGEGTNDEMCFNFLLVYPADGVLMCMDIGKISKDEDSAKMGICIDQGNQGSLAGLFAAGMGGMDARGESAGGGAANLGSLDAFADMTMVFEAPPKNISAYVDAVCVARAAAFEASSRPTAGSASTWLLATCVTGALASSLWSLPA